MSSPGDDDQEEKLEEEDYIIGVEDGEIDDITIAGAGEATFDGTDWHYPSWYNVPEDLFITGDEGKSPFMAPLFTTEDLRKLTNVRGGTFGLSEKLDFLYEVVHLSVQHLVRMLLVNGSQITDWNSLRQVERIKSAKTVWTTCRTNFKQLNQQAFEQYEEEGEGKRVPTASRHVYVAIMQAVDVAMYWQRSDTVLADPLIPATPMPSTPEISRGARPEQALVDVMKEALSDLSQRLTLLQAYAQEVVTAAEGNQVCLPKAQRMLKLTSEAADAAADALAVTPDSALEVRRQLWSASQAQDDAEVSLLTLKGDGHCAFYGLEYLYDSTFDQNAASAVNKATSRREFVANLALSASDDFYHNYGDVLTASTTVRRCLDGKWAGEAEIQLAGLDLDITISVEFSYVSTSVKLGNSDASSIAFMVFTGEHYNIVCHGSGEDRSFIFDKSDTARSLQYSACSANFAHRKRNRTHTMRN